VRRVYLDNAATTRVAPEVVEVVVAYMQDKYGNPSSVHEFGRTVRRSLQTARQQVAELINANCPGEIYFTGSGTEADNLAIKGIVLNGEGKRHIITSAVEHHAILHTCEDLEENHGCRVTYLPVNGYGMVDPASVREAIADDTALVSIMYANNEVGTIQPIREIAAICREKGVLMHTDAVQGVGQLPIDVQADGVDMLTLSAHKIYGPKGVGALYVRSGVKIRPIIHGGGQERGLRSGTEGIPAIMGLGKAAELARLRLPEYGERLTRLRDRLITGLLERVPYSCLNGHPVKRLPANANISFSSVEGEALLLDLDLHGIAASSGSACSSGSEAPSHVLTAMGVSVEEARGSVRLTLGLETSAEDIDYTIDTLAAVVERLRAFSPLGEKGAQHV
jgi:cysteine desulfurase